MKNYANPNSAGIQKDYYSTLAEDAYRLKHVDWQWELNAHLQHPTYHDTMSQDHKRSAKIRSFDPL
jgi:hypothetical protein